MPTLTNDAVKKLALDLVHADSEEDVITLLQQAKLWDDPKAWRLYGDTESNYSTIGNQQSRPEAALVEKVVNCVDARLMAECYRRGILPESATAPQSITGAVAAFFEPTKKGEGLGGRLQDWPPERQLAQARHITIAVTGAKARSGNACITIADEGEGQAPSRVPETFLSIDKKNKLRIPFVQGKFNMGGTGVLRFCGSDNIQVLVSRRDPEVAKKNGEKGSDIDAWGVTVVRRVRPLPGAGAVRNSVYRFLAPVDAHTKPNAGSILTFKADSLKLMPDKNQPYAREMRFGSVIKLYEYDMKGFKSHVLMPNGLLNRLEALLPGIALPVRMHECRDYKGVEARSFENSLVGLLARLEEHRAGTLEDGYPTSVQVKVHGEEMVAQIFAFKRDQATTYASNDGIIFTVNGQTHGVLPRSFFERKRVRMQRIAKSLLVIVDCSALSVGAREDLFMSSRDRLSNGELRKAIEEELEEAIGHHPGLRALQDKRRSEEIADRLADSKPLEAVLDSILKGSPTLSRLFLQGQRLSKPHKQTGGSSGTGGGADDGATAFQGTPHPSFFRFHEKPTGAVLTRHAEIGRRCRIKFDTDVVNDYFSRGEVRGRYHVDVVDGALEGADLDHSLTLHEGVANWSISLPEDALSPGDKLTLECSITDDTLLEAIVNIATIEMTPASTGGNGGGTRSSRGGGAKGSSGGGGTGGGKADPKGELEPGGLQMPKIIKVRRDDAKWKEYSFDEKDACYVVEDGDPDAPDQHSFTFYVNVDNLYVRTEMKGKSDAAKLMEAKFVYGNVLIGLALLHDKNGKPSNGSRSEESGDDPPSVVHQVRLVSRSLGPFLVPMIDSLGSLTDDQVSELAQMGDET